MIKKLNAQHSETRIGDLQRPGYTFGCCQPSRPLIVDICCCCHLHICRLLTFAGGCQCDPSKPAMKKVGQIFEIQNNVSRIYHDKKDERILMKLYSMYEYVCASLLSYTII